MPWWQVVLIIAGSIVIGLSAGYVVFRVFVSAAKMARPIKTVRVAPAAAPAPHTDREVQHVVPDLFAEIEYNRRIASGEWNGDPQPFLTKAWDNRGEELHSMPANLRNELTEAYSDMALANSITWLSTEMGRRSQSLDESYLKLRTSVSDRLNRVRMQLTFPPGQQTKVTSPR
jgi:hypothetical protein